VEVQCNGNDARTGHKKTACEKEEGTMSICQCSAGSNEPFLGYSGSQSLLHYR
jgi:hypothetical protein